MNAATDGGQAFPHGNSTDGGELGMTVRDYFAAKAMAATCGEVARYEDYALCTRNAYRLADAMLKARSE